MSLILNANDARAADKFSSVITESGVYVGIITRAEKLCSEKMTEGLGISFKADDGATANYLDIYTTKENGERLRGYNIAQAILCCTKTKEAQEGAIKFERWDKNAKANVQATANGYPVLMGKRIGLVLQKELSTNQRTGEDVARVNIMAVFEAATGFTASEILDKETTPKQLEKIKLLLEAKPLRDTRIPVKPQHKDAAPRQDFDDGINF